MKLVRRVAAVLGILVILFAAAAIVQGWRAFGRGAHGEARARLERSPQWHGRRFQNPQPIINQYGGFFRGMTEVSADATPATQLPYVRVDPATFATPPASGLRATWLGHSTVLVEIDGHRVLTDPMWSDRPSPLPWIGPLRNHPPPLPLADLPPIDLVVVSHEHYDHFDAPTISALAATDATFVVPLGLGSSLAYWGVRGDRIVELDWWDHTRVRGLDVTLTPARHESGRVLIDNGETLWGGFALVGDKSRVYYSGDTGMFPAMREIGERLGPFDLSIIEIGQYHYSWPDWHVGPEQAVRAHQLVRAKVMLPVHWGTFTLAFHGWTEPIERVLTAGVAVKSTVIAPRPGQSFEPSAPPPIERWWPELPWKSAAVDPVVSGQMGDVVPLPVVPSATLTAIRTSTDPVAPLQHVRPSTEWLELQR